MAQSGTIDLAVVRLRRSGAPVRASADVILAGGPGDSGVNVAMGLARQGSSAVWQLFDGDVVGIDQRGTGRSRPNLETQTRYDLPLDKAGSVLEWLPHIHRASRKVAEEFRARGIRLEAYNTRESADDVAAVRRALGYERLTLWGRSYGSHLALATVARHPQIVDRLVLVSPEGPNHTWKLPSQVDGVIRRLVERGATDLEEHMRQVLTRLAVEPVKVFVSDPQSGTAATVVLGAFDVQWITAQALGDPRLVATCPRPSVRWLKEISSAWPGSPWCVVREPASSRMKHMMLYQRRRSSCSRMRPMSSMSSDHQRFLRSSRSSSRGSDGS